ncbi:hypothetical protein BGZ61DRAFT_23405 [Ilyonectria robusta]|uniref:uncharacterized protein n=1 Tax=Ilyonectria robusta TaxID=1079257 RepID=UPI001E8E5ACE|nr:uncharacterized protein BGZ61DRAFT_23405 [Ilyonectria robusta]KAH8737825.1 hypothetical protein BGZ61DRAFT_23405 [Ilyonectria robusta]
MAQRVPLIILNTALSWSNTVGPGNGARPGAQSQLQLTRCGSTLRSSPDPAIDNNRAAGNDAIS